MLERSWGVACDLGYAHVGTEHLLLAIVREPDGIGAQVLAEHHIDERSIRLTLGSLGMPADVVSEREGAIGVAERPQDDATGPVCPACRGSLLGWLRIRAIDTRDAEGRSIAMTIAYCGRCSVALPALP